MARTIESTKTDSNGNPIFSETWQDSEIVTLSVSDNDDVQTPIQDNLNDNTLVEVPGGTYTLGGPLETSGHDRVGIVPVEGSGRIEIEPTETNTSSVWFGDGIVLSGNNISNQAFVGIDWLCQTAGYDAGSGFNTNGGDLLFKDVRHIGQQEQNNFISAHAAASSDNVVIEECDASYGMPEGADANAGILVGSDHAGSVYIHDCIIQHFADGGTYASNPWEEAATGQKGTIDITDSKFHNNNAHQNRFAGGTFIDNCDYKIADTLTPEWGHASDNNYTWDSYTSEINGTKVMRLFRNDYQAYSDGVTNVQNINVDATENPQTTSSTFALISDNSPAKLNINDSYFALASSEGIYYKTNNNPSDFTNVNVTIDVAGAPAIEINQTDISQLTFTDSCLDISNDPNALFDADSDASIDGGNLSLGDSVLNVGTGTVLDNSDTSGNSCTLPVLSGSGSESGLFENWTTTWNSSQSEWSVEPDASFTRGAKLTLDASSRGRRALIFDAAGTPADSEVVIIAKSPNSFGTDTALGSHIRPIVRGGTTNGDERGYFVETSEDSWELISYNGDGSATGFGTWGTPQTDTTYRIRLRANGTDIKAKTWENGETEPSAWDIEITDSKHSSGWCGVGSFETYDEFGYVGAGINGQTAPLPGTAPSVPAKSVQGVVMSVTGVMATVSDRGPNYVLIDSFEDGDISEYTGDTGDFSVLSDPSFGAYDGSNVLYADSAPNSSRVVSTSGLDNYFGKGEVAEFYHYVEGSTSSSSPGVFFGLSDQSNYYECQLDYDGLLRFYKNDGGTYGEVSNVSVTPSTQKWIKFKITWDDGTLGDSEDDITIEAIDTTDDSSLGSLTVNDATHATNTGIAWSIRGKDSNVAYDFGNKPE